MACAKAGRGRRSIGAWSNQRALNGLAECAPDLLPDKDRRSLPVHNELVRDRTKSPVRPWLIPHLPRRPSLPSPRWAAHRIMVVVATSR